MKQYRNTNIEVTYMLFINKDYYFELCISKLCFIMI